jgi:hypothetical protein
MSILAARFCTNRKIAVLTIKKEKTKDKEEEKAVSAYLFLALSFPSLSAIIQ